MPRVERLEARALLTAAAPAGAAVQTMPPPFVAEIYLSGTAWTASFKQALAREGGGDARYGTWWFGPLANPVPWANVDKVTIRFSWDVEVQSKHLRVAGANVADYPVASFEYRRDAAVATWTLARPFGADRILLELDGDGPNGVNGGWFDGDGDFQPGGDYRLRFKSLPGDVTANARVTPVDYFAIRSNVSSTIDAAGTTGNRYNVMDDLTADGRIDGRDLMEVRRRVGTSLPWWEPAAPAAAATQSAPALRSPARPATRSLFSDASILG